MGPVPTVHAQQWTRWGPLGSSSGERCTCLLHALPLVGLSVLFIGGRSAPSLPRWSAAAGVTCPLAGLVCLLSCSTPSVFRDHIKKGSRFEPEGEGCVGVCLGRGRVGVSVWTAQGQHCCCLCTELLSMFHALWCTLLY